MGWIGLLAVAALILGPGRPMAGSDGEEVIATWVKGEVLRSNYEAWLELRGREESDATLEGYVLTLWLAEAAVARRADANPVFVAGERLMEERLLGVAERLRHANELLIQAEQGSEG